MLSVKRPPAARGGGGTVIYKSTPRGPGTAERKSQTTTRPLALVDGGRPPLYSRKKTEKRLFMLGPRVMVKKQDLKQDGCGPKTMDHNLVCARQLAVPLPERRGGGVALAG